MPTLSQSASRTDATRAKPSKRYQGVRLNRETRVTVNGEPLNPRLDLCDHSPSGFEWGYGGSGPAQLAFALLADHFGDGDRAERLYQDFKAKVVAGLPRPGWTLMSEEIDAAIREIESVECR